MRTYSLIAILAASPVAAQDWNMRSGDLALSATEIEDRIVGQTLEFYDDGQSKFSAGGSYSYTYDGGDTAFGRFEIGADGIICIQYQNGFGRCDKYVQSGDRMVLLTATGERFPVRP